MDFFKMQITPMSIVVSFCVFVVVFYLSYTFLSKDTPKDKIPTNVYIYSAIISLVFGIAGGCFYNKFNQECPSVLLTGSFNSRFVDNKIL